VTATSPAAKDRHPPDAAPGRPDSPDANGTAAVRHEDTAAFHQSPAGEDILLSVKQVAAVLRTADALAVPRARA